MRPVSVGRILVNPAIPSLCMMTNPLSDSDHSHAVNGRISTHMAWPAAASIPPHRSDSVFQSAREEEANQGTIVLQAAIHLAAINLLNICTSESKPLYCSVLFDT